MSARILSCILIGLFFAAGACVPDPGPAPYVDGFFPGRDTGEDDLPLPGPDPYVAGEDRLFIGLFYEGEFSEAVLLNNVNTHWYIYADEWTSVETISMYADDDRVEGSVSDIMMHAGNAWWGGGIHWDTPRSLAKWNELHISLKSADSSFETFNLTISGGGEIALPVTDYGYTNDGEWHNLVIPLSDYVDAGLDLSAVDKPLMFQGGAGESGHILKVDNVYLE